jgi:transcriptional regulator with XRE-family HTH domain
MVSREVAERFGANVKRRRERARLSQEELALRASMHPTAIGLIERGRRLPRADSIAKLAGTLGIEPGDLFEGIIWEPGNLRYGQFKPDQDATL